MVADLEETKSCSVIHVPHAAFEIPFEVRPQFVCSDEELRKEVVRATDWFTDELFACGITQVRFPISRIVVDPERFELDADEPMACRGRGVIYMCDTDGRRVRTDVSPQEKDRLLRQFYRPHHEELRRQVSERLGRWGRALVIDAHSFPDRPWKIEPDQNPDRPDFCIGTDSFHTPDALRDQAVLYLQSRGFSVQVDRPYAGALVPTPFYRRDPRVCALMVEINRRLYMEEATATRSAHFDAAAATVGELCRVLVHCNT